MERLRITLPNEAFWKHESPSCRCTPPGSAGMTMAETRPGPGAFECAEKPHQMKVSGEPTGDPPLLKFHPQRHREIAAGYTAGSKRGHLPKSMTHPPSSSTRSSRSTRRWGCAWMAAATALKPRPPTCVEIMCRIPRLQRLQMEQLQ